jgi:seryl-tRNA synthetase
MLDIKLIRKSADLVRAALKARGGRSLPDLERLIELDGQLLVLNREIETFRSRRNAVADEVGRLKKQGQDASSLIQEMEGKKSGLKQKEEMARGLEADLGELALTLPNLPDASVPQGAGPQDNRVVREWGEKPQFDFKPKDHTGVGEGLGILDFSAAAKISGSRFAVLKGAGAALERALGRFMLKLHTRENGYTEIQPPYLVSGKTMTGTGQLPKFAEELYRCHDDDLYLIPTAEVSLTNLHRDETLSEAGLPAAYVAHTPCFRREAGSYGKDTRGLIRNHQFDKVELVRFCTLDRSLEELEILTRHAEEVLKRLKLPYRVLELCAADLGFSAAKTYDLEVWMPGEGQWREVSSCSTCGDFQARRLSVRVARSGGQREFVCTLNGSGLAVGRVFAAILENCQQAGGGVRVPEVLESEMETDYIKGASLQGRKS